MTKPLLAAALLAALSPAALAQPDTAAPFDPASVQLSLENKGLLRCSAAFALVSFGQDNGNEAALVWPRLDPRGQEFFVRSLAKLMDETGLDRDQVSALASREAQRLLDENQVDAVMPACLAMLESSNL
ncbi:hypothetical protein [Altererythrobacter sp. GH1-8]|uniref:hypothetical protein n=1 Tax=Altererythrobacter sp. GH1-8 TaxID=3349333 RepID=UPI00374DF6C6